MSSELERAISFPLTSMCVCRYNMMRVYSWDEETPSTWAGSSGTASNSTDGSDVLMRSKSTYENITVASLRNKEGIFVSPSLLRHMSFPYNASSLPQSITSPDWEKLPGSVGKSLQCGLVPSTGPGASQFFFPHIVNLSLLCCPDIPGAYPLGQLVYLIADENIGSTGEFCLQILISYLQELTRMGDI